MAKRKPAAKKKKTTAKKKTAAKKTTARKKATAKKSTARKKTTTRKAAAKKKTTTRKKSTAKKAAPKRKTAAKKRVVRKAAPKKAVKKMVVKAQAGEKWKKLPGGSSSRMSYMVSSNGRLKSVDKNTKSEALIKGTYTKGGYHQFNIKSSSGKRKTYYMHREVAKLFLPAKKRNQVSVCHKDGNKKNNKTKNLMWASKEQWSKLHKKLGTYKDINRDRITYSKLTEAKVKGIKKMLKAKKQTKTKIAAKYGVSITQINRIASGENWGHVKI